MLRLALIAGADESSESRREDLIAACARLRGIELTAVVKNWEQLQQNHLDLIDGVAVHVPLEQRIGLVHACAKAHKNILVDGPVAQASADVDQVVGVCRDANVRLMVGGTVRFQPSIQAIKVALEAGHLGAPALLRSHSWQAADRRSPDTQTQLFQQLDLALWMFKAMPTDVYANRHSDRPDTLQVHLGFPESGMALLTICHSLPPGDRYCSCTLIGSAGAAYSDDHRQMQLIYRGDGLMARRTTEGVISQTEELREFVTAISENRDPSVTVTDLQRVHLLTEAVAQSIATRLPLRWEGDGYVAAY